MNRCPNCDNHPLGNGYVAMLELGSGTKIEATLCGSCGTVYAPDAGDQVIEQLESEGEA